MKTVFPSFLSAVDRLSWFLLALFTSWIVLGSADTKQTSWPLHSKKPVLFIWNAPTQHCEKNNSVKLSLDQFDIVSIPSKNVTGQNLTTFNKENLGIYPYIISGLTETDVNGGVPQRANLSEHFKKMPEDIDKYIPDHKAKGLTVIDRKEWKPLNFRNGIARVRYWWKSQRLVLEKNPTEQNLEAAATEEFEPAAREFMLGTLRLGKNLRPNQLWGYYEIPECYEFHPTKICHVNQKKRDDELNWLWNESTALFPEISLDSYRSSINEERIYVQQRVEHAMRLGSVGDGLARPVFVYTPPYYTDTYEHLKKKDLIHSIGQSVALGAAGVIFQGDTSYLTEIGCGALNNYIQGDFGRYLLNVSTAAKECSQKLCNFNGRCLRQEPNSTVFLHLSPSTHSIINQTGQLKVTGSPGKAELEAFRQHFKCQCYNGTEGENCELEGQGEKGERGQSSATSVSGMWPLCFVLQLGLLSLFH